jgi:hypothetical protein
MVNPPDRMKKSDPQWPHTILYVCMYVCMYAWPFFKKIDFFSFKNKRNWQFSEILQNPE